MKHRAKEITINRGEGPSRLCNKPKTFSTDDHADVWAAAHRELRAWAQTAPTMGYDKVDYCVTYDDHEDDPTRYAGRFDMNKKHETHPRPLADDILSAVRFNTGQHTPHWMEEDRYNEYITSFVPNTQQYIAFMEDYEIGKD